MKSEEILLVYKISDKSQIRLTRTEFNADKWINLRYWAYVKGQWFPTKKGINLLEKYAKPFFGQFMKEGR